MYSPPKVMVVGGPGVGKATIFQRFISGDMSGSYGEGDILRGRSDLAFGYYRQWMTAQNKQVSMKLFGESYYTCRDPAYYHPGVYSEVKAVLLVYSIDDRESLGYILDWLRSEHLHFYYNAIPVFIGNKCDLSEENQAVDRDIVQETVQNYAFDSVDNLMFEISAKTGQGVQEMFDTVAYKIAPYFAPQQEPEISSETQMSPQPTQPRKRCLIQ